MSKLWALLWLNRTKVVGYFGMLLAQLGTSGLVGSKTAAWLAFASSAVTAGIGHFNDWQRNREARPPEPGPIEGQS